MTLEEIRLDITGMSCSACVASVEKIISGQKEVEEVSVNLALNRALVSINTKNIDALDELIVAFNQSKYKASVHSKKNSNSKDAKVELTC